MANEKVMAQKIFSKKMLGNGAHMSTRTNPMCNVVMIAPEPWVVGSGIQGHPGPCSGNLSPKTLERKRGKGGRREEGDKMEEERRKNKRGDRKRAGKLLLRRVQRPHPKLRSLRSRRGTNSLPNS